jgi:hypothetical protein
MLRRAIGILLLLAFLGLGSGLLEYLHNLEHLREDAAAGTHEEHDDSNCPVHRQLHLPLISAAAVPLLICVGLFVAFLTLLASQPSSHRPLVRLDCRGPPALLLTSCA